MQDLKITLIQSDLHWEDKDKNLEMFGPKIDSIKESTDLIVLPEMFNTGFTMNTKGFAEQMNGRTFQWMQKKSKEKKCVITGSLIIEEQRNYYNRLIWMRPDGSYEYYDKRHLFRMAEEDNFFKSGNTRIITEINGWKICPLVCYDLRFPVWSRNRAAEYDLLIYIANWPERRVHAWKSLLVARAIENQSYVAGLNRIGNDVHGIYHSGASTVINFKGEQISNIQPDKESIETILLNRKDLEEYRKQFPVGLDADAFTII